MSSEFLQNWREAPELGIFLDTCKMAHLYSEEEIIEYSRILNVNKGELIYRIESRHLNTQAIGTGEENYEYF